MADRLYTGLVSKQLRGNRDDALTLERIARTKVGYLFDSMMSGQTFRSGSWKLQDGRSIMAFVWDDVLGKRAIVRLTGAGGEEEVIYKTGDFIFRLKANQYTVAHTANQSIVGIENNVTNDMLIGDGTINEKGDIEGDEQRYVHSLFVSTGGISGSLNVQNEYPYALYWRGVRADFDSPRPVGLSTFRLFFWKKDDRGIRLYRLYWDGYIINQGVTTSGILSLTCTIDAANKMAAYEGADWVKAQDVNDVSNYTAIGPRTLSKSEPRFTSLVALKVTNPVRGTTEYIEELYVGEYEIDLDTNTISELGLYELAKTEDLCGSMSFTRTGEESYRSSCDCEKVHTHKTIDATYPFYDDNDRLTCVYVLREVNLVANATGMDWSQPTSGVQSIRGGLTQQWTGKSKAVVWRPAEGTETILVQKTKSSSAAYTFDETSDNTFNTISTTPDGGMYGTIIYRMQIGLVDPVRGLVVINETEYSAHGEYVLNGQISDNPELVAAVTVDRSPSPSYDVTSTAKRTLFDIDGEVIDVTDDPEPVTYSYWSISWNQWIGNEAAHSYINGTPYCDFRRSDFIHPHSLQYWQSPSPLGPNDVSWSMSFYDYENGVDWNEERYTAIGVQDWNLPPNRKTATGGDGSIFLFNDLNGAFDDVDYPEYTYFTPVGHKVSLILPVNVRAESFFGYITDE